MDPRDPETRVQALFAAALELDPARRAEFVRSSAADAPDVAREVLDLLEHEARAAGFLATPVTVTELLREAAHPARIGRYEILRVLGEGGMGVVYLARQDHPNRRVALKVLRASTLAPRALRRFEQEAQVLGRLHHPGIAAIHEAGTADSGAGPEPYFAMELVDGPTLVEHAERQGLGARERLALVAQVCDAVQHAHDHGIVHRDLKPANVLVDTSSGSPQPKVLDFGVARATDSDLATATLLTGVGQLVGTVPYMSPEQASGERTRIDARSDVYALGVLAYELLTGRLPHDFAGVPLHEAVRTIREDDPTPLSAHQPVLRGDVETIVAKALEKDPARRYSSASEFAADIRRFIAYEPVRARPPSALYRIRKFARRNRAVVASVGAVFLALVVGLVSTTWQARVAAAERDRAAAGWKAEEAARTAALAALERESRTAAWFQELLARASPAESGPDTPLAHVLDRAVRELPGSLAGAPEIESEVRTTIGRTYLALGRLGDAESQFRAAAALATGSDERSRERFANARGYLGQVLLKLDRVDEAEAEVEASFEQLAQSRAVDPARLAELRGALGLVAARRGDLERADGLLRDSIEPLRAARGQRDPAVIVLSISLGMLLSIRGDLEQAEALETASLASAREVLGPHHPETIAAMNNLACTFQRRGELERALPLFLEAEQAGAVVLGDSHPDTLARRNNLAGVLAALGRRDEAAELYARILPALHARLGVEHVNTLTAESNLGLLLAQSRRFEEAERVQRDNLEHMESALGSEDARTIGALFNLSWTVGQQRRFDEALRLNEECVARAERALPTSAWERWHYVGVLGALLTAMDRCADARPHLEAAARELERILGAAHPRAADARAALARCD
ncbi:MAG: serine/threonine protein kinase [Planctomycetes bacterium]|nr:serine/threonine protein kinase [Planctomycetota bacterium]